MGSVAITNTFTSGTTAEAPQVNTNFSDLVNYINARNSGSSKWDALGVSGNAVIDGTLSVSGTDFATALATAISADGWTASGETWTYASATTFTISGDKTTKYTIGDKIKLVQTTQKYFYIIGTSYSFPDTTITVSAGSDYSLVNAAITVPYYSKMATPNGFPGFFNFTTTFGGFSLAPSLIVSTFSINGKICFFNIYCGFTGTSNSTSLTFTLPLAVATNFNSFQPSGGAVDNGSFVSNPIFKLSSGSATVSAYKSYDSGIWTNSGSKVVQGSLAYPI